MSNNPYEESKFARFASSKGFYAVLAACLIGAGASAAYFLTEDNTVDDTPQMPSQKMEVKSEQQPETLPKSQEIVFKPEEKKVKETPPQKNNEKEKKEISVSKASPMGTLPCKGEVKEGFSNGELIKDETMGDWRTHNGIDIMASEGSDVVAFASGKVKDIRNDSLWGTVVEIEHQGAVVTKYCGLNENVKLTKGDSVKSGETIGKIGFIPAESTKGSHLHFELIEKGKYKNPMEFIK